MNDFELVYHSRKNDGNHEVISPTGQIVMVCRDSQSASHYTSLLNGAYRAGYKSGYRAGRKA